MDGVDFSGLVAKAVAGLDEVRACLLVSRDGLTLGAYPQGGEERAREAWSRLGAVGDPERGFLVMTDEVWVFARRGAYACIVVGSASAKAGLLLDRMEATLRAAEEARQQSGSSAPSPSSGRRSRLPLHREVKPEPAPEPDLADQVLDEVARVLRVPEEAAPEASVSPPPVREAGPSGPFPVTEPVAPQPFTPEPAPEPPVAPEPLRPISEPLPPSEVPEPPGPPAAEPPAPQPMVAPDPPGPESLDAPVPTPADPAALHDGSSPATEDPSIPGADGTEALLGLDPLPDLERGPDAGLPPPGPMEPVAPAWDAEAPPTEAEFLMTTPEPDLEPTLSEPSLLVEPEPSLEPEPSPEASEPGTSEPEASGPPRHEPPRYTPPADLLGQIGLGGALSEPHPVSENGSSDHREDPDALSRILPEGLKEEPGGDDTEVDPVALAREFAQLFDEPDTPGEY